MARFLTSEDKQVDPARQLTVIHTQRFTKRQWEYLCLMKNFTGCEIPEYIRRLVDADLKTKEPKLDQQ